MDSKRKRILNGPKKDAKDGKFLGDFGKSTMKDEPKLSEIVARRRKSILIKSSSPDNSKGSALNAIIMKKKNYFKKIKLNNKKKHIETINKIRLEMISKFIIYVFSNIINIISIFNYVLQTYFDTLKDETSAKVSIILINIELSTSVYFLFEYFLLMFRVKGDYWRHILSFESLIDLVTTGPSIVTFFFLTEVKTKISFIRIFRIFRVFRILRIYKSLRMMSEDNIAKSEIDGEIREMKQANSNPIKLQFFTILVILVCNFFICSGLVLGLQDLIDGAFSKPNLSFFDAFFFIIITCSSVGYGDIIPTHTISRFFVVMMILTIIVIISHQVSKLAYLLNRWGPGFFSFTGTGHIIVLCDKTINLEGFIEELKKKNYGQEIIIISHDIEKLPSQDYPFNKVYLMNVGLVDLEVLERANTKDAECIFIFSSKVVTNCNQNEKVIEFLILKINRYFKDVNVYVQTLYSERAFIQSKKTPGTNVSRMSSFFGGNNMKTDKDNILKYKKIIPILRLKSLMISKNLHNPGFLTFSQNLLFNDTPCPTDLDSYDPLMRSYFLGCDNKIHIRSLPKFFIQKDFCESMLLIYSKSINDYFTKVSTSDNPDENRPVLLIGVIEKRSYSDDDEIKLYPNKYLIKNGTFGIFISYDGNDYLNKFLRKFDRIKGINQPEKQSSIKEQEQNLNLNLNEMRRRRSAMFELNTSKFLRNKLTKPKIAYKSPSEKVKPVPNSNFKKGIFKNEGRRTIFADNDQVKKFDITSPIKNNSQKASASVNGAINQMRKLSQFISLDALKGIKEEEDSEKNKSNSEGANSNSNSQSNSNSNSNSNSKSINSNSKSSDSKKLNKSNSRSSSSNSNSSNVSHEKENIVSQLNQIISKKVIASNKTVKKSSTLAKRLSCFIGNTSDKNTPFSRAHEEPLTLRKLDTNFSINSNNKENQPAVNKSKPTNKQYEKRNTLAVNSLSKSKAMIDEFMLEPSEEKEDLDSLDINKSINMPIMANKQLKNSFSFLRTIKKGHVSDSQGSDYDISSVKDSDFDKEDYENRKKEAFFKRKNIIEGGHDLEYENKNTKINILLFQSLEERNVETLTTNLEGETMRRYGRIDANENENDHELFFENRIFDIEKNNISEFVSNHILILGYQDNLSKLIKLISFHHPDRDLCIVTSHEFDEKIMYKLLKQFKFLIYLKGDVQNPFHLLNAGVHKAFYVIFLVENIFNKTNEDMNKILSFKSIDYFFNTEMCLELWDTKSTRLIGYQPIDKDTKVVQNEFLHPQFCAGRILYMSHLERISAISHNKENVVETWVELLSIGFKSTSSSAGFKTLKGIKAREGFPVLITINVPQSYVGKEYYVLMSDLLSMEQPVMPLGIYIENPLTYQSQKSEGKVTKFNKVKNVNLRIQTSYKKKLQNIQSLDRIEQGYMDNLRILRDISNNDKVVLDYVDIRKPHLPIFITNPPPGFILDDKCKVMVMYHYSPKTVGLKNFHEYMDRQNDRRFTRNIAGSVDHAQKQQLLNSQDNFYFYVNSLKEKIRKKYTKAFKLIEQKKENE